MSVPDVVLDTNLFVAAGFNPGSDSARILAVVRQGRLRMVWNDATRGEIVHVLRRIPPLAGKSIEDIFRTEDEYKGETTPELFTVIEDFDDRKFAALAHAAGATIVSQDEHLLQPRDLLDIPILTPGEFWREYGNAFDL
jgi:uncharacterized protein